MVSIHAKGSSSLTRSSSTTIEALLREIQLNKSQSAVAYYYFNFQPKQNSSSSICYNLSLYSFVVNFPAYRVQSIAWYSNSKNNFSDVYLMSIIEELLKTFGEVYIVIDALDECEQGEELFRWIQQLIQSKDGRLHLLISSCQNQNILSGLKSLTTNFCSR